MHLRRKPKPGSQFGWARRSAWFFLAGLLVARPVAWAAPLKASQINALFASLGVVQAALAPDGRHVAFAVRMPRGLEVHILPTGQPDKTVKVRLDRNNAAELRVLSWISPERLLAVAGSFTVIVTDPTGQAVRTVDTRDLFRRVPGADDNLRRPGARVGQAPDDPAVLLFESNFMFSDPEVGIPGRKHILEVHRLDVLTGEVKRLMEYDVETGAIGVTIMDRQGKPRLVYRALADPIHFVYRTTDEAPVGLRTLFATDYGWRGLGEIFHDPAVFSFGAEPAQILGPRTIPLGLDHDAGVLFFASNLGRDTFGIYAADVRTGQRTAFALETPGLDLVDPAPPGVDYVNPQAPWKDSPLIYDRKTHALVGLREPGVEPKIRWLDAELAAAQGELEGKFPSRRVRLLEWDDTRERFLALVRSAGDPGRYFVFHRGDGRCIEFLRAAPALPLHATNPTEAFDFKTAAGVRLTGYLTLPRTPAGKSDPPLVVALHGGPWEQLSADFDRDAQLLATMGLAVVKINYRGSTGLGLAHREALREHLDTAPVDDVLATLEWLRRTHRRVDLRRVGLVGEDYGGYLALRALQLHPDTFQSVVAINGLVTPADLWSGLNSNVALGASRVPSARIDSTHPVLSRAYWLIRQQSGLGAISVAGHAAALTKPVFLLHDLDNKEAPAEPIAALRRDLQRRGRAPEWMELPRDFVRSDSLERGRVYLRIGEFLNRTLNEFSVKIGEAKEKAD